MAHAQLIPDSAVSRKAIRYQSVLGTSAVLIASLIVPPAAEFQPKTGTSDHQRWAKATTYLSVQGTPLTLRSIVPPDTENLPRSNWTQEPWQKTATFTSVYGSTWLLTGTVKVPNNQYDWPLPRGKKPPAFDWKASFPLPLTTHAPPFLQMDWPNPRGPLPTQWRGFSDSFKLPLTTHKPFAQEDWPNPRGSPPRPDWSDSFKLPLTTHAPPYLQTDWPNPRGARSNPDWIAGSPYVLITVAEAPFFQTEWPVPRGVERHPDWVAGLPQTLLSDRPLNQYDWPNPRGTDRHPDWSDSFKLPLTTHKGTAQYDWPNPRGAKPVVADWVFSTPYSLSSAVAPPFFQIDWPNPRGAKPVVADWSDSFKLPLTTVVGFNQYDWPNPRGAKRHQDWSDSFKLPLTTHRPHRQHDWPVPKGGRSNPYWTDSFKLPLTTHKPFAQTDWPVPKGAKPKVADWSDSFKLPLTTVKGTAQYDWPVPQAPRRSGDLGWLNQGLGLVTVVVYPATITFDWPNPTIPKATPRGFTDSFKLPLTTHIPRNQFSWPNPTVTPPRSIELRTWLQSPRPQEIVADTIPLSGLREIRWQRAVTYTTVYPLPLTLRPPFVAETLPFRQHLWPNPLIVEAKYQDFTFRSQFQPPFVEPPIEPEPEPGVPPKHSHAVLRAAAGQTTLDMATGRGQVRTSGRVHTSSRWRRSRTTFRTGKSRTTPRDDP